MRVIEQKRNIFIHLGTISVLMRTAIYHRNPCGGINELTRHTNELDKMTIIRFITLKKLKHDRKSGWLYALIFYAYA